MEGLRSQSCKAPTSMQELRCYQVGDERKEVKMKKSKSSKLGKSTFGESSSSKGWSFNDPELQRKTRVASYKVYAVEGKMKGSLRKSFKWIKNTCTQMVHGL